MEKQPLTLSPALKKFAVKGKFIYYGNEKFYIKGVTYGTFKPDENGLQFPIAEVIEKDFALMAQQGINTVRTYTVPPIYLLDIANKYQLKVMAGLPWEQHITFLDSHERIRNIIKGVKNSVLTCGMHPAILCFTIGNEIPAPIVRWYGNKKIENFIHKLYTAVKIVNPDALVTYVNYPSTEYLNLPFLDFDSFNVYLEKQEKLDAYLQRLHNLTGDRPLVLAEIGLDSLRNGSEKQAEILDWQLKTIFTKGCAGALVFAWTDEWWRGGFDIEDWDFGLVDRDRNFKPALHTVSKVFAEIPFNSEKELPFISVLICSRNGGPTIRDTMEGLLKLDYPNFETIVVNDGSTDNLAEIVGEYPVKLISTPNRGLSSARNTALQNAGGGIVAYIDDDAYPDPHWLRYLAFAYQTSTHAAIGGPNIAPDDDGPIATCVANSPGGPVHVLINDELAEHIPGCNMSFRREALLEIGGFDPVFRAAGDDVDICWRIQHTGRTIGFHPSALVWHHRRNSIKAYWKQQKGYGKAEALLEAKWPEKYNGFGHLSWVGRIYGNGLTLPLKLKKDKVFHGVWGSAPFQSVYQQTPNFISYIPLMPEFYLLLICLSLLAALGVIWTPLLWLIPVFLLLQVNLLLQAGTSAAQSLKAKKFKSSYQYLKYWGLTTFLHMVQPFARLYGRLAHGLTPWRKNGSGTFRPAFLFKTKLVLTHWSETWKSMEDYLQEMEYYLITSKARVRRGGQFDRWDLQVSSGNFTSCRSLLTIEEHGGGKQLLRFKCAPHFSRTGLLMIATLSILSCFIIIKANPITGYILAGISILLIISLIKNKAMTMHNLAMAFESLSPVPVAEDTAKILPDSQEIFLSPEEANAISGFSAQVKILNPYPVIKTDFRQKRDLEPVNVDQER